MIKKGMNTTCDRCHRVNVHAFPWVCYYVYFCTWWGFGFEHTKKNTEVTRVE